MTKPDNSLQEIEELIQEIDMSVVISCHHPMADNGYFTGVGPSGAYPTERQGEV